MRAPRSSDLWIWRLENHEVPLYALAMSAVVGRELELERVEGFFGRSGRGRPTALGLFGEPGIGKTTVWAWAVARARARSSIVLVARPAESEARLSFAGLADLLSTVPESIFDSIPAPQRTALDAALLRTRPKRPPERRVIGTALLSVLRALSEEKEVVVAVDDLHWLDAPSAAAVEFASRRLVDQPVLTIASVRSEEPEPPVLASLASEGRLDRLELGPLSVASLHRVLARELGRTFPRPTLVRIAAAARGNPLYAIEIARLIDRWDVRAPLAVPGSLSLLVASRVGSLPPATREALLRAAVLARPELRLVEEEALAPAEQAGLVRVSDDGQVEFVHPLYASAVYASAPATRRRATHRALAEVVEDPEQRARHLALACNVPDAQVAREVAVAARRARLRGAPDTAAELMSLALGLTPPGEAAVERRIELAENLYVVGDFDRGAELLEQAQSAIPRGDLRARALLLLAELVYRQRGEREAAAIAREALAVAQDPILRVRCHVRLAGWAVTSSLRGAAADVAAASELLEGSAATEPGLRSSLLVNRIRVDLCLGRGLDLATAQRALELEQADPPRDVDDRLVYMLGVWFRYVDDFGRARSQLEEAQRVARDEGDDASLVNILQNRMLVELLAGEWPRADELAGELGEIADQLSLTNIARAWIAYLDAHRGRLDEIRDAAATADRREALLDMLYLRALGTVELCAGLYEEANEHLAQALAHLEAIGVEEPAIWRIDGEAIEAALGAGDLERARRLVARFEARADRSRIPWSLAVSARCRGLLHAAEGELEPASEALERALVEHRNCPMPFEAARTLLAHGRVLRRRKLRRRARKSLEEARGIFAGLGADPWTSHADEELRRIPIRRAPADLSATEQHIARLAAEGLSNRLIAERAFVSVKTVETNLKRAYRKLGISSRAQLARALDDRRATVVS
jgi:DNA-binding CsgD family transcriptional regulator